MYVYVVLYDIVTIAHLTYLMYTPYYVLLVILV